MSKWTDFIKEYAKKHNLTYTQALSDPKCSEEYFKANEDAKHYKKEKKAPTKKEKKNIISDLQTRGVLKGPFDLGSFSDMIQNIANETEKFPNKGFEEAPAVAPVAPVAPVETAVAPTETAVAPTKVTVLRFKREFLKSKEGIVYNPTTREQIGIITPDNKLQIDEVNGVFNSYEEEFEDEEEGTPVYPKYITPYNNKDIEIEVKPWLHNEITYLKAVEEDNDGNIDIYSSDKQKNYEPIGFIRRNRKLHYYSKSEKQDKIKNPDFAMS